MPGGDEGDRDKKKRKGKALASAARKKKRWSLRRLSQNAFFLFLSLQHQQRFTLEPMEDL